MKRLTSLIAAFAVLAIGLSTARAADRYWDINGVNAGATDDANGDATGDVTLTNWSTDPAGLSATVVHPQVMTLANGASSTRSTP